AVGPLHHPSSTEGREVAHPVTAPSACVPSLGVSSHTLPASVLLSRKCTGSSATVIGLICTGDDLCKVTIRYLPLSSPLINSCNKRRPTLQALLVASPQPPTTSESRIYI
ncbi:hypothetical protein KI387_000785, partial [Taxus chinensis]